LLLPLQLVDLADPFFDPLGGIVDGGVGIEDAGVDAEDGDLAGVRV